MNSSPSYTPVGSRIPELDGLGGWRFSWWYFTITFLPASPGRSWGIKVFPLTWTGVDLFFVLSGFLIGGIFLDFREHRKLFQNVLHSAHLPDFSIVLSLAVFVRHCTVVIPALHFLQNGTREVFTQDDIPRVVLHVFFTELLQQPKQVFASHWLAATWSLAVEEQFYLLLPLVIWLVPSRKLPGALFSLILFVPVPALFVLLFTPQFM